MDINKEILHSIIKKASEITVFCSWLTDACPIYQEDLNNLTEKADFISDSIGDLEPTAVEDE